MKLKLSLGKDYTLDFVGSSEEFVKTIPFSLTGVNQLDDTKSVENDNRTVSYANECKEKGLDLPAEEYVNKCTKILHVCSKGHTYKQTPNNHLSGQGCPKCQLVPNSFPQMISIPIGTLHDIDHLLNSISNLTDLPEDRAKLCNDVLLKLRQAEAKTREQYIK